MGMKSRETLRQPCVTVSTIAVLPVTLEGQFLLGDKANSLRDSLELYLRICLRVSKVSASLSYRSSETRHHSPHEVIAGDHEVRRQVTFPWDMSDVI